MRNAIGIAGLLATVAILGGCAQQRIDNAKAEMATRVASCNTQFPPKVGNHKSRALCLNDAFTEFNNKAFDGRDGDLIDVYNATRLSLATKVDRGEITPEDENLQLAVLKSKLATESNRRTSDASAAAAAQTQANTAALLPLLLMQQQYPQPQPQTYQPQLFIPPPPPQNRSVHCTSYGGVGFVNTDCN